jgi:hypothetical protein
MTFTCLLRATGRTSSNSNQRHPRRFIEQAQLRRNVQPRECKTRCCPTPGSLAYTLILSYPQLTTLFVRQPCEYLNTTHRPSSTCFALQSHVCLTFTQQSTITTSAQQACVNLTSVHQRMPALPAPRPCVYLTPALLQLTDLSPIPLHSGLQCQLLGSGLGSVELCCVRPPK